MKRGSPMLSPMDRRKTRHLCVADTLDPADVIDRVEYQESRDGGVTWRVVAFCTDAVAAAREPGGVVHPPGLVVRTVQEPGVLYRTVIEHRTGKALSARCAEA